MLPTLLSLKNSLAIPVFVSKAGVSIAAAKKGAAGPASCIEVDTSKSAA